MHTHIHISIQLILCCLELRLKIIPLSTIMRPGTYKLKPLSRLH